MLEKAGVTMTLLATVKATKLRYFGHTISSNPVTQAALRKRSSKPH